MSKKNRDNGEFVQLHYRIADLVEYNGLKINGNMKILLSFIYSYGAKNKTYYESVGTIGIRCGCGPQAVRSFRDKLRDAGMITFEEREGSSHKYASLPLDETLMVFIDDERTRKKKRLEQHKAVASEESHEQVSVATAQYDLQRQISDCGNIVSGNALMVSEQIQIFDDSGRVTEEFITSLDNNTEIEPPKRNEQGKILSFRYVYWLARAAQDLQNGLSVRTPDEYMKEAMPEHIPSHLLAPLKPQSGPELVEEFDDGPPF
ncbi:hypothetical protein [Edwardsiella tarda]|uniref:hypothetical protein n=1 Tax=Edwardsiella tarda TaxID=636 RepID=UPI00083A1FCE|nr:hypothetical protein [Edwardsiella tarda]SPW26801.1 Uncharacterised protein [Edwardsiella tarda]